MKVVRRQVGRRGGGLTDAAALLLLCLVNVGQVETKLDHMGYSVARWVEGDWEVGQRAPMDADALIYSSPILCAGRTHTYNNACTQ